MWTVSRDEILNFQNKRFKLYIAFYIYIYTRKFCNQLKLEKQNSYENKILTIFKYILCMYSLKFFLSKVSELKVQ